MKKKSKLPKVKGIWTVDDKLGGWAATQKHFFDEKVCWCKLLSLLHKANTGVMSPSCTYVWSAAA
jgi:ABC-type sulfate transport system substrate-binding protein